jgi:succinate dehydrogenase / fumarate reductase cytochrome b subunit
VSTAVASDRTAPLLGGQYHFLLRRLHSLTGIIFGGYLVVHLIINATIAQFGTVYQVQVDKLEGLPFLWAVEWIFIYIPILYHTIYGIWIILTGQWNVDRYPYEKNWFYVLQRISAVIIVAFIIFHVFALKAGLFGHTLSFDIHNAGYSIHRHMAASWVLPWIVYPIGILASCYHLANGIWTAGITWGLTVSAGAQRRWGYLCGLLFILTLACGFIALVASTDSRLAQPHPNVMQIQTQVTE